MICVDVGATNADIAGLGIILAFAIQAFISLVLSAWSFLLRDRWERDKNIDDKQKEIYVLQRGRIDKVLATCADAQTLTGIALLLSGLIQSKSLELYHFHILYDTVNFTAVSFCAAILCSLAHPEEAKTSRYLAIGIFSVLYLTFAIIFGQHLKDWDYNTPGSCYNTRLTATPDSSHPYVDRIYLGITCLYMFSVLVSSIAHSKDPPATPELVQDPLQNHDHRSMVKPRYPTLIKSFAPNGVENKVAFFIFMRSSVLVCALLQFPLHLYSIFALRTSNQHLLTGDSENTWGFGQIVALVMVGQTFIECFRGVKEYREERKKKLEE